MADHRLDLPPRPVRFQGDELAVPGRLLLLFRDSYAAAQGRQWLQPHLLWWVLSLLRDHDVRIDWSVLRSPELARTACSLAVPHGHVTVSPPEQTAMNFRLWWRLLIDIATHVNRSKVALRCSLPTSRAVAERAYRLGLRPWMSSAAPEEMAGIAAALAEIRRYDRPRSRAPVDAVMADVVLPNLLIAEAHWLRTPGGRPSAGLRELHGRPGRELVLMRQYRAAVDKACADRYLTPFDHLYLRAGDLAHAVSTAPVDDLTPPLRRTAETMSAIRSFTPDVGDLSAEPP